VKQSSTSASARSGALGLTVAVHETTLRVSLSNEGDDSLRAYFAADSAGGRHHDFLTVELVGEATRRTLRFTGDRDSSTTGLVELGAGDEVADELDLPAWARDPINGGSPLAAGEYALTATYSVNQPGVWSGSLSAGPVRLLVPSGVADVGPGRL
jgi:hypothetical protein